MLRLLIVVSSLVACSLGASLGDIPESRLIGGKNTSVALVPWQVSLVRDGRVSCGGAIVTEKFIMTSAHCLYRARAASIQVRVNATGRETGGVLYNAIRVVNHKFYDAITNDYDIGLIELSEPLVFGAGVQRIRLPEEDEPIPDGALARITGWGWTTVTEQKFSDVLQEIVVPVWKQQECSKVYNGQITSHMFCAGQLQGVETPCEGDSGGPVVVDWRLVGITSFGRGCGDPGVPGVFTRVASLLDWWDYQTSL